MMVDQFPPAALPSVVIISVGLACILLAGAVLALALRRRQAGFDPMLIASAAVVMLLAVVILATR